jgi:hypothetical protein
MDLARHLLWKTQIIGEIADLSCSELMYTLNKGRYALISAGNSHEGLRKDLERAGYRITPAVGNYAGNTESMFMVHDPDERDMIALSARYLQHSVVLGEKGTQRMIFTNGPQKGHTKAGRGWKIAAGREGQFTEINTSDGETVQFTLQF